MAHPSLKDQVREEIASYRPSEAVIQAVSTTPIVILAGISGAGKDVIREKLLTLPGYTSLVTTTTRGKRENHGVIEQDGKEYHFIGWQEAKRMLEQQAFIETNFYADNLYGTTLYELQAAGASGKTVISKSDTNGAAAFKKLSDHVQTLFITPPSYAVWFDRMMGRYNGSLAGHEEDFQKRLKTAIDECRFVQAHPYFECIINDSLEQAVSDCIAAISHAPYDKQKARVQLDILLGQLLEAYRQFIA